MFTSPPVVTPVAAEPGSKPVEGTLDKASGDYVFDVPPGEWAIQYAQVVDDVEMVEVVETDARTVDLSRDIRKLGIDLNFEASHLADVRLAKLDPWLATDELDFYAPDLLGPATNVVGVSMPVPPGATTTMFKLRGSPDRVGSPLWIFQRRRLSSGADSVDTITRSVAVTPQFAGDSLVASLDAVGNDRSLAIDWDSKPFSDAATEGGGRLRHTFMEIRPFPTDAADAVWEGTQPIVRIRGDAQTGRIQHAALNWGNPFAPAEHFLVAFGAEVRTDAPNVVGVQVIDLLPAGDKPLSAELVQSKPRHFTIDQVNAASAAVQLDSEYAWDAPATGRPTRYVLRAFCRHKTADGAPTYPVCASVVTTRTHARFAAGALKPGRDYVISLTAENSAKSTPGEPHQVSFPYAVGSVATRWVLPSRCSTDDDCSDLRKRCHAETGLCQ